MLQKKIIKSQQQQQQDLSNTLSPTTSNSTSSYQSFNSDHSNLFNSPFQVTLGRGNSNINNTSNNTTPSINYSNNSSNNTSSEYLSFSPISNNDHFSEEIMTEPNNNNINNINNMVSTTTTGNTSTSGIDGADSNQRKINKENVQQPSISILSSSPPTPPPQSTKPISLGGSLSSSSSNEELNWSSLNSKMKSVNKYDAKRGSILIEHLTEYNRLASSQVILGEETVNDHNHNHTNNSSNTTTTTTINNNNSNNKEEKILTPISTTTTTTTTISSTTTNPTITNSNSSNNTNTLDSIVLSGINLFNDKPKKGIEFFIQHKLLEKKPESVAEFLHSCSLLNKKSIGDYLGDIDPFSIQTLEALIGLFNFQDLDFDMAIRQLLYTFRLPGEAQKIDRIMQKFANQFYKDNIKSVFEDPDAVYMLAFAIILLNTDVHNPQIKNKMPKSKFGKSLHGINAGKDLPIEYIEDIYDRIIWDEIKMEPTSGLFPYACKKGWLNIRVKGRVTDKWSRKWCILSDGTLYFFRKPTDTTPVRYLHPDTVITTQKEMKGRKNCFILNHSSPPLSIQSLMMIKDHNNPQKYFNPQAIFQQLAAFGKEKKKEPKFWDSVSEKFDQKLDMNLFNDSFDTDSIGSFDTLSESSNYYDEDLNQGGSSINSTSPIHGSSALSDQKKKMAFSLRLGNKKTKDQLNEFENEFENGLQTSGSNSNNGSNISLGSNSNSGSSSNVTSPVYSSSPNSSIIASTAATSNGKPPVPARTHLNVPNNNSPNNNNNPNSPNHSLTQPRPTIYKQGSSSLIRSSSISTFSTPTVNVTSANSSNGSSPSGSSTSSSSSGSGISTKSLSSKQSSNSSTSADQTKKTIEDIMKQQEKLIKSSKQQTTVIINADTKREMDSWIRLILSQFKNNK